MSINDLYQRVYIKDSMCHVYLHFTRINLLLHPWVIPHLI